MKTKKTTSTIYYHVEHADEDEEDDEYLYYCVEHEQAAQLIPKQKILSSGRQTKTKMLMKLRLHVMTRLLPALNQKVYINRYAVLYIIIVLYIQHYNAVLHGLYIMCYSR